MHVITVGCLHSMDKSCKVLFTSAPPSAPSGWISRNLCQSVFRHSKILSQEASSATWRWEGSATRGAECSPTGGAECSPTRGAECSPTRGAVCSATGWTK